MPKDTYVSINIYDLNGKIVKSLVKSFQRAGVKNIMWEGTENWDELLLQRARESGKLVLSDFTKNAINSFKKNN